MEVTGRGEEENSDFTDSLDVKRGGEANTAARARRRIKVRFIVRGMRRRMVEKEALHIYIGEWGFGYGRGEDGKVRTACGRTGERKGRGAEVVALAVRQNQAGRRKTNFR